MVAGGHVAQEPEDSISLTVCSLSTVRTVLFLAELNDLKLTSIKIGKGNGEGVHCCWSTVW